MNTSTSSLGQTQHQQLLQQEKQRKQVSGLGTKPHNLAKQNEAIQRMLSQKGPATVNKPITSREPLLPSGELKDGIGGTPKPPRKIGQAAVRGNSQSRVIERQMVLPPSTAKVGNTILQ